MRDVELTFLEREEISRGIPAHRSARPMARLLGHSASTVSREISRNGAYHRYRATVADEEAWVSRPKRCKLADNPRLPASVARKLTSTPNIHSSIASAGSELPDAIVSIPLSKISVRSSLRTLTKEIPPNGLLRRLG